MYTFLYIWFTGYKPPAEKSMGDMLNQDKDDASLEDYKRKLLGDAQNVIICEYKLTK